MTLGGEIASFEDKSDNSYSVRDPDRVFEISDLISVVVNGEDIKSTLTKK